MDTKDLIIEFKRPDVTIRDGDTWEQWQIIGEDEIMAVTYAPENYPSLVVFVETFDYFVRQFFLLRDEKESIMKNEIFNKIIRNSVEKAIK